MTDLSLIDRRDKLALLAGAAARKRYGVLSPASEKARREREAWVERCRTDLYSWSVEALRHLPVPQGLGGDVRPALHHRLLISELEDVLSGKTPRLIIEAPPGSAKSTYVSLILPSAAFQRRRNMRIIGASHTADLALDFSGKLQGLIRDAGDVLSYRLRTENKQRWYTTNGGAYLAAGVGQAIPGFRADCLVAGTLVTTRSGVLPIDDIEIGTKPCCILSYDETHSVPTFSRVIAVARRRSSDVWRVRTASGRVVEGTGNHRVHTSVGWKPIASLAVGDVLLRAVRQAESSARRRVEETEGAGKAAFLRVRLRDASRECLAGRYGAGDVPTMRKVAAVEAEWRGWKPAMLGRLPSSAFCGGRRETAGQAEVFDVRRVRKAISVPNDWEDVQSTLCRSPSFEGNDGTQESRVSARDGEDPGLISGTLRSEEGGLGSGSLPLRGLRDTLSARHSSHQLASVGPSVGESRVSVSRLPQDAARCGAFEAVADAVAVVERVRGTHLVYDLQVEGTSCFFAGDLLVHNCGIIDDPFKSRKAADSETGRKDVWEWYNGSFERRLTPGAPIVIVLTRWHEADLVGMLLETQAEQWRVIRLPAEAEEDDPLGREPGEWLWDDDDYGYGAELALIRDNLEASGETREWASQYQQRPRPREGSIFKVARIGVLPAVPAGGKTVRAYDLAATKDTGTRQQAYTAGVRMSMQPNGRVVIEDVVRERAGPDEVDRMIVNTAGRDGRRVKVGIPQDPGQAGKSQVLALTKMLHGFSVASSPETGDKVERARSIASQVNVGNVDVVEGPWNRAFLEELACAEGGTEVATRRGSMPIAQVRAGDYVATRMGWRKVLWAGKTGRRELIELRLSSGRCLRVTPDHPIYLPTSNFTNAGLLRVGDRLLQFTGGSSSFSTSGSDTSEASWQASTSICTASSGNMSAVLFQPDFMFTTPTKIRRAMRSTILSASRRRITRASIVAAEALRRLIASTRVGNVEWSSFHPAVVGMAYLCSALEGAPIGHTPIGLPCTQSGALRAAKNTWADRIRCIAAFSARASESTRSGGGDVTSAEMRSSRDVQAQSGFAANNVRVEEIRRLVGLHDVYDLTVSEAHEFVAEGVLIHNSFPAGATKDQVDATSRGYNMLLEGGRPLILGEAALARLRTVPPRDRFAGIRSGDGRNRFARAR